MTRQTGLGPHNMSNTWTTHTHTHAHLWGQHQSSAEKLAAEPFSSSGLSPDWSPLAEVWWAGCCSAMRKKTHQRHSHWDNISEIFSNAPPSLFVTHRIRAPSKIQNSKMSCRSFLADSTKGHANVISAIFTGISRALWAVRHGNPFSWSIQIWAVI